MENVILICTHGFCDVLFHHMFPFCSNKRFPTLLGVDSYAFRYIIPFQAKTFLL